MLNVWASSDRERQSIVTDQGIEGDRVAPLQRGANQAGMRAHNERLVLSLVRRIGPLAKTEIARLTGLSAQTVSVIMRKLESDRLLKRGMPNRGRVGQPSVPLSLDPEGAFFLGAKIGRRSLDIVLVDFAGEVRQRSTQTHAYPSAPQTVDRILAGVEAVRNRIGAANAGRIAGLGLAMPFALWDWTTEIGAPDGDMNAWRDADIRADLAAVLPYPVYLQNDGTAACGAELAFGAGADLRDFIYFHVGAFIGGGLVLNGGLFTGRTGNAAALGSMPVQDAEGRTVQLIDVASLILLERSLTASAGPGRDAAHLLYDPTAAWDAFGPELDVWIEGAARGIAQAIAAACCVIDLEAAIIDGAFPQAVRSRLLAATDVALRTLDLTGIRPPDLREGSLGAIARALGGASLPLFDRYLVEQHALAGPRGEPAGGRAHRSVADPVPVG